MINSSFSLRSGRGSSDVRAGAEAAADFHSVVGGMSQSPSIASTLINSDNRLSTASTQAGSFDDQVIGGNVHGLEFLLRSGDMSRVNRNFLSPSSSRWVVLQDNQSVSSPLAQSPDTGATFGMPSTARQAESSSMEVLPIFGREVQEEWGANDSGDAINLGSRDGRLQGAMEMLNEASQVRLRNHLSQLQSISNEAYFSHALDSGGIVYREAPPSVGINDSIIPEVERRGSHVENLHDPEPGNTALQNIMQHSSGYPFLMGHAPVEQQSDTPPASLSEASSLPETRHGMRARLRRLLSRLSGF